ncbi:MAG TPA: hypothetical protein VHP33_30790 [Polyangiaceae bacterium]|nr:hypothetical protein [Polyangiaceae bacterium]
MSKAAPPPLLGFNNNVRHRGRIFHIQTEDSGVKFPRIVTHLFADGGRIVKTTRTDYSEHVEKPDMAVVVRGMMKEQHKAMFAALRAGDMDPLLENVCGPLEAAKAKAPESVADPTAKNDLETARVIVGNGGVSLPPQSTTELAMPPSLVAPAPAATATAAPTAGSPEPGPVADAQAVIDSMKSLRDSEEASRSRRPISNPNLRRPTPSVAPPAAEAFDLDVASLDKNPPKSTRSPPPPPVRPPRKSNPAPRKSRPPIPVRPASATAATPAAAAAAGVGADLGPSSLGRPQTRLAAAPQTNARSIFGDGAISEQSLDEVILSYLAEDLEEPK